jgi:hypothetical protein
LALVARQGTFDPSIVKYVAYIISILNQKIPVISAK